MTTKLFTDIGKKIKLLSKILFWVLVVLYVCFGIIQIKQGFWLNPFPLDFYRVCFGVMVVVFAIPLSWLGTCILYAFGELVDKTCDIEKNTMKDATKKISAKNTSKHALKTNSSQKEELHAQAKKDSNDEITVCCPECGEELVFYEQPAETVACIYCDTQFKLVVDA